MFHGRSTSGVRLSLPLAMTVMSGCGGGTTGPTPPPPPPAGAVLASVIIKQAPSGSIEIDQAVQLSAEARDTDGELMTGQLFTWTSSSPAIATISTSGRMVGRAPGQTTITLSSGSKSASIGVTVSAQQVLAVGVFPPTLALSPTGTAQLTATALGNNGNIPGATIAWTAADPDIATVDATGRVTATGNGITTVTATSGGVSRMAGITVSNETLNIRIARLDFIQIAQTAAGDVPLVAGKATAIRLYPEASEAGLQNVPIDLTIVRAGVQQFATQISSGQIPLLADQSSNDQGIFIPVPAGINLNGAIVRAVIDPDNNFSESDEWDNASAPPGADPVVEMQTIAPFEVRLVPIGPQGTTLASFNSQQASQALDFSRLLYPTPDITVSVRGGSVITTFPWITRADVSNALNQLEVERLADGFTGHYYGVMPFASVDGIAGLGQRTGRSALGTMAPDVIAHEVGHNMGLGHTPGCGADGINFSYPYPNGQIGIRGWDPRTNTTVPPTFIDMMGYCGNANTTWISGGYYSGIYSILKSQTPVGTLRARPAGVVPVAVTGTLDGGLITAGVPRAIERAISVSPRGGEVTVELLDGDGTVVFDWRLKLMEVNNGPDGFAGIVPVDPAAWSRAARLRVLIPGSPAEEQLVER